MRHTHSRIGGSVVMHHADSKWRPDAAQFFMAPQFIRRSSCSSLFRCSHPDRRSQADNRPGGHRPAIRQSSAEPGAVKVWKFSERLDSPLPNGLVSTQVGADVQSTGFSLPGQPKGWSQNKELADLCRYHCPNGRGGLHEKVRHYTS